MGENVTLHLHGYTLFSTCLWTGGCCVWRTEERWTGSLPGIIGVAHKRGEKILFLHQKKVYTHAIVLFSHSGKCMLCRLHHGEETKKGDQLNYICLLSSLVPGQGQGHVNLSVVQRPRNCLCVCERERLRQGQQQQKTWPV